MDKKGAPQPKHNRRIVKMNLTKWLPWNFILKWAAKRYDILDPVTVLARIRQFGQPSEVMEPIELLRAGILFHARGRYQYPGNPIQPGLDMALLG